MSEPKQLDVPSRGLAAKHEDIAAVAIGRNEGERLKRCLRSIVPFVRTMVYVDSGSTDGSIEFARSLGVEVVDLDMSRPFTAARARNAGFKRVRDVAPESRFVYFTDGDCEMVSGWLEAAIDAFNNIPDAAIVAGRLREKFPDASIYNRLCDMEWNTATGEVEEVGGIMVVRSDKLAEAGGFDEGLIAGEEPELCCRLRALGGSIHRLPHEMALHDAAMTRFSQWWKRSKRNGYAFANVSAIHGSSMAKWKHSVRSQLIWGVIVPIVAIFPAIWTHGFSLAVLLVYPLQIARIAWSKKKKNSPVGQGLLYGLFCVLGKFPELIGSLRFYLNLWRGRRGRIIEYK